MENEEKEIEVTKDMVTKHTQFIAIEGVDCTGKGSITDLIERMGVGIEGVKTKRVDFPQYDLPSGQMILNYLNGKYGDPAALLESVPEDSPEKWLSMVSGRANNMMKQINFIASLYSLNRIEYFMLNEPEPNTVYVFDRYMYSNAVHQLSLLFDFYRHRQGAKLIESYWVMANDMRRNQRLPFNEFHQAYINDLLGTTYGEWVQHEVDLGVPMAFEIILTLDRFSVFERLKKRKNNKHAGADILEEHPAITRACNFVSEYSDFAMANGVVDFDVKECNEDNKLIAQSIIELYKAFLANGVTPETVPDFIRATNLEDEEDNEE